MNTLHKQHYDELQTRLRDLTESLELHWPEPAEARDDEVAVTAYRKWSVGPPVLVVTVAPGFRLLPVVRRHGYRWTLRRAGGEAVAGPGGVDQLSVEVPDLPEGCYRLKVDLPPRAVVLPLSRPKLAALSAPGPDSGALFDILAEFHSPEEEVGGAGMRGVQLRRFPNDVLTLWATLGGPAAGGRLARFTILPPSGGEPWQVHGFVGADGQGVGEVSLRKFDYRLQRKLSGDCTIELESVWPEDLEAGDRPALEQSRDAAVAGREALQAALDRLSGRLGV